MAAELGALTEEGSGCGWRGWGMCTTPVLAGSAGELTEVRMDASLSGDYRPLVQLINSLERDKMFFVIDGVTLTGQQTGTVNLRLRLTTYLRGVCDWGRAGSGGGDCGEWRAWTMKLSGAGTEDRNKLIAVGAFVVIAAAVFYFEYFGGSGSSTPAPAPAVTAVSAPADSAGGSCGAGGEDGGNNIRGARSDAAHGGDAGQRVGGVCGQRTEYLLGGIGAPPVVIPKPIAQARQYGPSCADGSAATSAGPPPPPPIDLKFFGTETAADGTRLAFLLHNDDVMTASAGDVVMRRYKVVSIEAKTIQVEDMQYNNTQTLPLLTN